MRYLFFGVAIAMFLPSAYDAFLLLQQNGYEPIRKKEFWINYLYFSIFVALATFFAICFHNALSYLFFASAVFASLLYFFKRFFFSRGRVKVTKRLKRLVIVSFFLYVILALILLFTAPAGTLCILFAAAAPLTILGAVIVNPFEKKNNLRYEKMLADKLSEIPHLIRIGVTGSAGKTSVKNYLYEMLSTHFRVLKTEQNYNTPLGLWLTVKDKNLEAYDVFIAEMGARKRGDIKRLVELVKPDAGIVTAVLPQHLETFHTLDEIAAEKSELARGIISGIVVLNADDKNVAHMANGTLSEVITVGEGGDYEILDLIADYRGTSFTLSTPTNKLALKTDVIGVHNAKNIALAAALALRFGIPDNDVVYAVDGLKSVPHRLELTKTPGGIFLLDDGYNSNVSGAECALNILSTYPGRRVVFAQGIVELGAAEKSENVALGKKIAQVADVILLTGRLGEYIYEGAVAFDAEIHRVSDVKAGQELLKTLLEEGDILYLQNDLPELYR